MKTMVAMLSLCFAVACAHGQPPNADVSPKDAENFDVSVHGRLQSECGVGADKIAYDEAKDDALDKIADCLTRGGLKGHNIRVVGYTDPRGTAHYNKELGRARADVVASYLEKKGVPADKIIRSSRGEASATGAGGFDRRVDIGLAD
jgi:outer membrane protein OmpA-like peptidoglycan-associated protein